MIEDKILMIKDWRLRIKYGGLRVYDQDQFLELRKTHDQIRVNSYEDNANCWKQGAVILKLLEITGCETFVEYVWTILNSYLVLFIKLYGYLINNDNKYPPLKQI